MPVNRRSFLSTSVKSAGALYLQPRLAQAENRVTLPAPLDLKIMATNWGIPGTLDSFCARAAEAGYDGIEIWVPRQKEQQDELKRATEKHGLRYGFLAGSGSPDFATHLADFKEAIQTAIGLKPLYINCHSGKDYFSFEQSRQIIEFTLERKGAGIPIYHETHRARILFTAPVAKTFIEAYPELRLTLDISHWCCVHGTMLEDQAETIALALAHTGHIHSRVGHRNGPQVSDPSAPEWERETNIHLGWWDEVAKHRAAEGVPLTITTEFGPPSYMPTLPYTNQPVADLWGINVAMQKRLRERYKAS